MYQVSFYKCINIPTFPAGILGMIWKLVSIVRIELVVQLSFSSFREQVLIIPRVLVDGEDS